MRTVFDRIRKRHIALVALFLSLAVIIMIHNNVRSSAVNSTFYLKDLYGQHSQLSDVIISGNIQDGYHNNAFKINNGIPQFTTYYYHHYKDMIPSNQTTQGFRKIIDNREYELRLHFKDNKVLANIKYYDRNLERYNKTTYGEAILQTEIISEKYTGNSYTTANSDFYVITNIGDRIFFTIPTTEGYKGTNGIFEVIEFSDTLNYLLDSMISREENEASDYTYNESNNRISNKVEEHSQSDNRQPAIRTVTAFSIDENNGKCNSGIEVLGLQGVNDKLVLILRQDHALVFRAYDSTSGNQLGEVIIDDMRKPGTNVNNNDNGNDNYNSDDNDNVDDNDNDNNDNDLYDIPSYLERYEAFVSDSTLSICFRKNTPGAVEIKILNFEVSDNIKLTNIIDEVYTDGDIEKIHDIYHKDNKVYVMLSLIESDEKSTTPYYSLRQKQMYIYVYNNSSLSYKGELVTDLNEDDMFQIYAPAARGGISYNFYERRLFENIQITSTQ
jgi:hypothetical protein